MCYNHPPLNKWASDTLDNVVEKSVTKSSAK
jgi:uncharacterized protein YheU (UPF0270 family)